MLGLGDSSNDMFYERAPEQLLNNPPQPPYGPASGHLDHSERASVSDKPQLRLLADIQQPALPAPSISVLSHILPDQPTGTRALKVIGHTGQAKLRNCTNLDFYPDCIQLGPSPCIRLL
jgi:hypothetical protein